MPNQPLRIAVTMLSIAIGLTIALATSGSLLSGRSDDSVASSNVRTSRTELANSDAGNDNEVPDSSVYPRANSSNSNESRPFPVVAETRRTGNNRYFPQPLVSAEQTPLLRDVVTDLPHGAANRTFIRASSSQGEKGDDNQWPTRLGYEELPIPPHHPDHHRLASATGPVTLSPQIDFHDEEDPSSTPYPPVPVAGRHRDSGRLEQESFGELQAQIVSLRGELQQVTKSGLSRELEEIQRLRELLHELQSLRQLSDLQAEVQRLAQRQTSLESVVDEQSKGEPKTPVTPESTTPDPPVTAPVVAPGPKLIVPEEPAAEITPERVELKAVPRNAGQWNLRLREASIAETLDRLCEESRWNAAVGPGVVGTVNMTLTGVTLEQALQSVAKSVGCEVLEEGNLRMLVPAGVAEARRRAARQPIAKIISLSHIAAIDVAPLVTPLLTPHLGEVGITSPGTECEQSGGPRRAIPDALVVVDYGDAVSQIEALVAELDVPPPEVEIDAVILRVRRNEKVPLGVMSALRAALQPGELLDRLPGGQGASSVGACDSVECVPYRGSPQRLKRSLDLLAATSVSATPHIRVLNRQTAEIAVGENVGYRSHTLWRGRRTPKEQDVELLEAITRLKVTPYVRPDGTIRLQVHPYHSHVVIDPKTDLPRQQTAEAFTDVTIPDGCTLVIGGLISHTDEYVNNSRGPINFLKRKLRRASGEEFDEEIVIMLTPRLVEPIHLWEEPPDEFTPMPLAAPPVSRVAPGYQRTAVTSSNVSTMGRGGATNKVSPSNFANPAHSSGRFSPGTESAVAPSSRAQGTPRAFPPSMPVSTPAPVPPPPMTMPQLSSRPITQTSVNEDSTADSRVNHATVVTPAPGTTVPGPPDEPAHATVSPLESRSQSSPPGSVRLRIRNRDE